MGVIEFTCQACSWNLKGHMSFCPKCGANPMKAPMRMAQIMNAPYENKEIEPKVKMRYASTMARL